APPGSRRKLRPGRGDWGRRAASDSTRAVFRRRTGTWLGGVREKPGRWAFGRVDAVNDRWAKNWAIGRAVGASLRHKQEGCRRRTFFRVSGKRRIWRELRRRPRVRGHRGERPVLSENAARAARFVGSFRLAGLPVTRERLILTTDR